MAGAYSEIGPTLQPRWIVQTKSRELKVLAERAMEFAGDGPTANLSVALAQFERMRAVLGETDPAQGAQEAAR